MITNYQRNIQRLIKIKPDMKVQYFIKYPGPWIKYNSPKLTKYLEKYKIINHREILPDEIVIDVDADDKQDGFVHSILVEKQLKHLGLKYTRWKSGGDGEHFHLFFKGFSEKYPLNTSGIKYLLIKHILGKKIIKPKTLKSHICLFDKKLIQLEYALHRKGRVKTLYHSEYGINEIPKDFLKVEEKWRSNRQESRERINNFPTPKRLNCINFFEGKTINGLNYFNIENRIHYRVLFSMCAYYMRKYKDIKIAKKYLLNWFNSIPDKLRIEGKNTVNLKQMNIILKTSNHTAGCFYNSDFLDNIQCIKVCDNCPYNVITSDQ